MTYGIVTYTLYGVAPLTLSLLEPNLESINMVVPFESVDEALMCDHVTMENEIQDFFSF